MDTDFKKALPAFKCSDLNLQSGHDLPNYTFRRRVSEQNKEGSFSQCTHGGAGDMTGFPCKRCVKFGNDNMIALYSRQASQRLACDQSAPN
jgi:hypothetical protein